MTNYEFADKMEIFLEETRQNFWEMMRDGDFDDFSSSIIGTVAESIFDAMERTIYNFMQNSD